MELDDVVEESLCHREGCIGVPERYKVNHLGETIDDRQHHRFTPNFRKSLHKIHGDVAPYH